MADAIIEIIGQDDLPTIVELHNQLFRPPQDVARFKRRCLGRYNVLQMLARVGERPVGFLLGAELDPHTFGAWSCGVHPELRRQGIATQLLEAAHEWARNRHYEVLRIECSNSCKPMMHMLLDQGYDIVGVRCDPAGGHNVVKFEKDLVSGV